MSWEALTFYAFVLVTCIQLYYYLYFFRRVAFYKQPVRQQSQQHPVSVVICARDEDKNLEQHLPSVLAQAYSTTHEVIVVNDNSFDDSKYILEGLQKSDKKLQVVELTQEAKLIAGKKYPLSIGIKEAKHEVLLLTDADCVPASDQWLYKMQDAFTDGVEVALGYGAYQKAPGFLNKAIRFETFHTALQYFGYALAGRPYMGVGRNLAYRKNLFFRNKGFSSINHIPSGDDDLFINQVANRYNTAVVLDPEAFTLSAPKTTWRDWRRQKAGIIPRENFTKHRTRFCWDCTPPASSFFTRCFLYRCFFRLAVCAGAVCCSAHYASHHLEKRHAEIGRGRSLCGLSVLGPLVVFLLLDFCKFGLQKTKAHLELTAHPDLPGGKATYTQPLPVNESTKNIESLQSGPQSADGLPTGKGGMGHQGFPIFSR